MIKGLEFVFDFLAIAFDKIPGASKIKGLRTIIGFIGLATVVALQSYGIGSADLHAYLWAGFLTWTGLSLNAKGRPELK